MRGALVPGWVEYELGSCKGGQALSASLFGAGWCADCKRLRGVG